MRTSGLLAKIVDCQEFGVGKYRPLRVMGDRIRAALVDDDPYPRAEIEMWPDDPDGVADAARISNVEDRMVALLDRIGEARGHRSAAA